MRKKRGEKKVGSRLVHKREEAGGGGGPKRRRNRRGQLHLVSGGGLRELGTPIKKRDKSPSP